MSALTEVPPEANLRASVDRIWQRIHPAILDELPFEHELRLVDELLSRRAEEIKANALNPEYDWAADFDSAVWAHNFNKDWINYHRESRLAYVRFWQKFQEETSDLLKELSIGGQKTILLLHGAVALGALNILTKSPAEVASGLVITAKFAVVFSVIGILSLGLGQLLLFRGLATVSARLANRFSRKLRWRTLRAFHRWSRRSIEPLDRANWFIYGSIWWFASYSLILSIMLLSI